MESDLQEIVKEISIMKQCDSPYIVKYFGSYFKDADLWVRKTMNYRTTTNSDKLNFSFDQIVMEYCGAGSVSDMLKLRGKTVKFLQLTVVILVSTIDFILVERARNSCDFALHIERTRISSSMQ